MLKKDFLSMAKIDLPYMLSEEFPGLNTKVREHHTFYGMEKFDECWLILPEENIRPELNLDIIYDRCKDMKDYEVMDHLIDTAKDAIRSTREKGYYLDTSVYKWIYRMLRIELCPTVDLENIENRPFDKVGPYTLVAFIEASEDIHFGYPHDRIPVTNEMMEQWGVSRERIFTDAKRWTYQGGLFDPDIEYKNGVNPIKNEDKEFVLEGGSNLFAHRGFYNNMRMSMSKGSEGFYILPISSKRMWLIDDGKMGNDIFRNITELEEKVINVQEEHIPMEYRIPTVITHYDATCKKFETALEFAERKSLEIEAVKEVPIETKEDMEEVAEMKLAM